MKNNCTILTLRAADIPAGRLGPRGGQRRRHQERVGGMLARVRKGRPAIGHAVP
jgi:hypothetical protein